MKPQSPKLLRAISSSARQIMFHGPRNTSKSYTHWKCFASMHELIPELQSFIVRTEAKTIHRTVLKTFLRMLKYPSDKHKKNPFEIVGGINFPQRILWANGGVTEFGGLDDPEKILGGDYHMGWYNEIHREKREESFSNLLGCFVGDRAGPLPDWVPWRYRLYLDCNPTAPGHFIYRRRREAQDAIKRGEEPTLEWYNILHQDNPMLGNWDPLGNFLGLNDRGQKNEQDLLDAYPPGYMRDRMVYGIPRAAEGVVYPMWSERKHVKLFRMEDFGRDAVWRWSVDIGGRDPHAIGIFVHFNLNGRPHHHLFKEVCSLSKIEDTIEKAEALHKKYKIPKPSAVFIDWNVKDFRDQLEAKGYPIVLADKDVLSGVEVFKEALADEDFSINPHSLEYREPLLGSNPQGLKEEIPSYAHKPPEKRTGSPKDDLPDMTVGNDHFCDLTRYYFKSLYLAPIAYGISYSEPYIRDRNTYDDILDSYDINPNPQPEGNSYYESF